MKFPPQPRIQRRRLGDIWISALFGRSRFKHYRMLVPSQPYRAESGGVAEVYGEEGHDIDIEKMFGLDMNQLVWGILISGES
jgi:hypothetical protein